MHKLKHSTVCLVCITIMSFVMHLESFADIRSDVVETDIINKSIDNSAGRHFELIGSTWYSKGINNESLAGWTYDEHGNLYLAREDGSLVINQIYEDKEFNSDGVLMLRGIWDTPKYKQMCIDLEAGKGVNLGTTPQDVTDFFQYYIRQYRLWDNKITIRVDWDNNVSAYVAKLPEHLKYNREQVIQEVVNKFGIPDGDNPKEIVYDACRRVSDGITYDLGYNDCDMLTCLRDGKSTCWALAKYVKTLAEQQGVEVEVMCGIYNNDRHAWLRYRDGDTWKYADPTGVETSGDIGWHNMPYETLVNNFIPEDDAIAKEVH